MIISASRRTDIPAFFTPWFMNRIRAGYVFTRNPFNIKQIKKVSLLPEDVDTIVFWTRNASPLISFFAELDQRSYHYYFLYTITGYPRILEKNNPNLEDSIQTFKKISRLLGPDRIVWRFDPILISRMTLVEEILRLFKFISKSLEGYSSRVIISFLHLYPKVSHNLRKSEIIHEIEPSLIELVSKSIYDIAISHNFKIQSCAQKLAFENLKIKQGSCIDPDLIEKITDKPLNIPRDSNQRRECTCIKSIDIGAYNTCLHGCTYCYATRNEKHIQRNLLRHNPDTPFLITYEDEIYPSLTSL